MKGMKFVMEFKTDVPNDDGKGTHTELSIYQNADNATDISEKDKIFNNCFRTALGEFINPLIKMCMTLANVGAALNDRSSDLKGLPPQPSAGGDSK